MRTILPVAKKLQLIKLAKQGAPISQICKQEKVSRTIFYRWMKTYRSVGPKGKKKALSPHFSRGKMHWKSISRGLEKRILLAAIKNPSHSPQKIAKVVGKSHYCVWSVLRRHGLNTKKLRDAYIERNGKRIKKDREVADKMMMIKRYEAGEAIVRICRDFMVSRTIFYRWLKRYQEGKEDRGALESLRPSGEKHWRVVPGIQDKIVAFVQADPKLSAHKISELLLDSHGKKLISSYGVHTYLKKLGLSRYIQRVNYAGRVHAPIERPVPQVQTDWKAQTIGSLPNISAIPPPSAPRSVNVRLFITSFFASILFPLLFIVLISTIYNASGIGGKVGIVFSLISLLIGMFFFLYSVKYYLTIVMVLSFSRHGKEEGEEEEKGFAAFIFGQARQAAEFLANGRIYHPGMGLNPDLADIHLKRTPFVSIHIATYNEKRVVNRLLTAATSLDYDNYEVIIADDSTDETITLLRQWEEHPRVKLIHRESRSGFKGAALSEALKITDPRAEFVIIFDADFIPYPDTITQFLKYFQSVVGLEQHRLATSPIAAVQGYQWHVLNKSENWITRGVRSEYAGSYVIERSGAEIYGGLKQISGSVYMVRREVLERIGWGTSITEDFQLTLKLYEKGYKVVYTPYIQAPAEAVSTLKRLIRQRMRWAEGHSYNIRKMFTRLLFGHWKGTDVDSSNKRYSFLTTLLYSLGLGREQNAQQFIPSRLSPAEKFEFLYLSPYYLQAAFFICGTLSWFIAEIVFQVRLPFWTEVWGWSLVLTNLFALPMVNMVGLFMEESEEKDYIGLASFVALSYIVAPFQAYAAIKGFLEKEEGPWFRTPKTGRITDTLMPGRFYRYIRGFFGRPAVAPVKSVASNFEFSINNSQSHSNSQFLNNGAITYIANSYPAFAPIRIASRLARRGFSKSLIALIVLFSITVNMLALHEAKFEIPQKVEAQGAGPTKLGESKQPTTTPKAPKGFHAEFTKVKDSKTFLYETYIDDDNMVLFGREPINAEKNADERRSIAVVRIVSSTGKHVDMTFPGILDGPRIEGNKAVYEFAEGLLTWKLDSSQLTPEITWYEPGKWSMGLGLSMSKALSIIDSDKNTYQIRHTGNEEVLFLLDHFAVKDSTKKKQDAVLEYKDAGTASCIDAETICAAGGFSITLKDKKDLSYPLKVSYRLSADPSVPVMDFKDKRDDPASSYNYEISQPKGRGVVEFGEKPAFAKASAGKAGYKYTTGDKLYNMELKVQSAKFKVANPTIEANKIIYDYGSLKAEFRVWTDRVKGVYTVNDRWAMVNGKSLIFGLSDFSMIPRENEDGSISLMGDDGYGEANNREVFKFAAPTVVDAHGKEGKITMKVANGLIPVPLVPKYCEKKDKDCHEPQRYYDRSGAITLTIDPTFLTTAVYPLTIDPTIIDSAGGSLSTAYGSQRHIVRMSSGTLVFGHQNGGWLYQSLSFDDGVTWVNNTTAGQASACSGISNVLSYAIATLKNEIHDVCEDPNGSSVKYDVFGGDITFRTCTDTSCTTVDQSQTNTGGAANTFNTTAQVFAQSFKPGNATFARAEVWIGSSTTGTLNIELRNSLNSGRNPDMSATIGSCTNASLTANAFNGCNISTTLNTSNTYFINVYCTGTCNFTVETRQPSGTDYANGYNLYASNSTSAPTWHLNEHIPGFLILDNGTSTTPNKAGTPTRPSIVIDKNNFPAVSWGFETSGGTKASSVRFSRANADPQTKTNWTCATASSCNYVKLTNCTTDVCGDVISPQAGVNSVAHTAIAKAPSTATTLPDALVIIVVWNNNTTLYGFTATVNGTNYNAWATNILTTAVNQDLSVLAVDDGTNRKVHFAFNDSTNPNIAVWALNADNNNWVTDALDLMTGNSPSLAYDAQTNKLYVWAIDQSADTQIIFRKISLPSGTADSANQKFDIPAAGQDLIYPNLKEDNAPTTSPGPKLDLVYMNNDNAKTPTYTVFYSTWHTKETRHFDSPTSLPTTEALTITSGDDGASAFYSESDYTDSNSSNSVWVPASSKDCLSCFFIHTFKKVNANNTDQIQISWVGQVAATAAEGCSITRPCTLQIYQWGNTGCTAGWGDFDTGTRTDTTTGAGINFTLTGNRTTNLSCYYSSSTDADDHLGTNTVAVRVYKEYGTIASGSIKTDVITFTFVPENVLWLLPLALFMPKIIPRLYRLRKRYATIVVNGRNAD